MTLKRLKIFAATALIAGAGVFINASTASAVPVYNDAPAPYDLRANFTCSSCSILVYTAGATNVEEGTIPGDHVFDTTFGELFNNIYGSSEAGEALWINSVLGTSFTAADLNKSPDNDPDWDGILIKSSAAYVILKLGHVPNYTVLRNDSGGEFSFTWNGIGGTGAGLSHYTHVAAIPLPAAGFLLIGALGSLVGLRRRRKMT